MPPDKDKAIQAFHLLNYFVGDLVAASQVRRMLQTQQFSGKLSNAALGCINRMCLAYLFLTLNKLSEFYDRFHSVVPDDCKSIFKDLVKDIRRRKVKEFRDTFVGHVWDKRRNRPLTNSELEAAVLAIVDDDPDAFVSWCNDFSDNPSPDTVIGIVEHTREQIRYTHRLSDEDLFPERYKI